MEKIADVYTHIETENSSIWFKNGRVHREGREPASIHKGWGGKRAWLIDGEYSREDNRPHIEYDSGTVEWRYADGRVKRVAYNGYEEYYKDWEAHRDERDSDGLLLPAVITNTGKEQYFLHDREVDRHGVRLYESSSDESN
jgi:hypothetical protein